jgi:hypothetical protein
MKKNIKLKGIKILASFNVLTLLMFLTFGLFVETTKLPQVYAAADSTLSLTTTPQTVGTSTAFTLNAVVGPGSHQVSAVEMFITYDQTKFSLTSLSCSTTFGTILYAPAIPSPENGTARLDCGVPDGQSAVTTSTTAATLSFTSLTTAVSNSTITFTASSKVAADDQPGTNELGTINPASITVTAADTTPPSFTINDGASASWVTSDTINVTVSDASGVASEYYGFSTDNVCNSSDTISTAFTSATNFTIAGDHNDYLCLKATDNSSNHNVGYQLVGQLHTDNTAPTFTINDGTSATSTKSDTINVTVADAGSGVASEYYGFSTDNVCNSSDTISTAFTSGTNFAIAGNHSDYLCLKATDNVGNTSYQLVGQLHTDNTAPTVSQVTAVPSKTFSTAPSFVFSSSEVGTISYSGDCTSTTTSAAASNNTIVFSTLGIGNHTNCVIYVTDAAGNQSTALSVPSFAITYRSDFNQDDTVDALDYTFLHTYYGTSNATADANGDGVVDALDYAFLHSQYGDHF